MTVRELSEKLDLTPVSLYDENTEVSGCYIGDMLSVVMSKANEGDLWLTVQTNVNIIAVAVLTGASCIVTVEGMTPDEETIKKATAQGVNLFSSSLSAYELAARVSEVI
ncbi:MAG: hypothetical protein IKU87_01495 [Clostridia bacterium]|nr:hypothetical protein [Clostridia bacterium]